MALPSATKAEDEEKHHQLIEEAYKDLGVKYPKQDQHMLYRAAENLVKARANGSLYEDIIRMDVREKPWTSAKSLGGIGGIIPSK